MKTNVLAGLAVVVLAGAGILRADEPLELRYKFEPGKPLIYRTETSIEQVNKFGEMKITTNTKTTDHAVRTLEKVDDDGNFQFKTETKKLAVKISGFADYAFDSTATEREKGSVLSEALNPLYERMSGAQLTVVATPRGTIKKVDGYEELLADLLKDNPLAAQFSGGGSKQMARMAMQDAMDQFDEKAVKPGDRWEIPYVMELPKLGKAEGKWVYTYEGPDKVGETPTAKISVMLDLSFDLDLEANGAKVTGKLSVGESKGTIQFDPKEGRIVSKKSKYTLNGGLTVAAGGNTIPVELTQTQTIEVELLDKLP